MVIHWIGINTQTFIFHCELFSLSLQSETFVPEESLLVWFSPQEIPQQIFPAQRSSWFEDHIPVVEASLQVHHSLLGEPRSKHVLTVDLAPQVPVTGRRNQLGDQK